MKRENIRRWLRRYREVDIVYSKHVREDKFNTGKVKESDVRRNLLDPAALEQAVEQEALNPKEYKYKLRFKLSRAKDLGVVVQMNDKLKVVTAYLIEHKWQKRMAWWLWKKKSR